MNVRVMRNEPPILHDELQLSACSSFVVCCVLADIQCDKRDVKFSATAVACVLRCYLWSRAKLANSRVDAKVDMEEFHDCVPPSSAPPRRGSGENKENTRRYQTYLHPTARLSFTNRSSPSPSPSSAPHRHTY